MEWAFATALHDCLPHGSVVTGEKPAPEIHPPGAADIRPDDRADVDVVTVRTGKRIVFDVRTVNVQCASARTTAETQCAAIEAAKRKHYSKYFRSFKPFVITLSGAVSQASAEALTSVTKAVARGDRNTLDWEPARWTDEILHRLSIEMVKTAAVIATRHTADLPPPRIPSHRAVACHVRAVTAVSAGQYGANRVASRGIGRPAPRELHGASRCVPCHKL